MSNKIELRRKQVYDLYLIKHEPVDNIAKLMKVAPRTIRRDVVHIHKQLAKDLNEIGHEQLLVNLLEELNQQKNRIFRYLQDHELHHTARAKYEALLIEVGKQIEKQYEKLAKLAIKIGNSELEDSLASMTFTRFNETIGLPLHASSKLPRAITQAQMKVFEAVDPSKRSWIILNKARQCGFTELVLRTLVYYSFSKYRGKKIGICAGTRIETGLEIFNRLKDLFRNINDVVLEDSAETLRLKNGTSFHVIPASKHAVNGLTGFAAFLLDEANRFNLDDDSVIINNFLPLARTNMSDVFMISNPYMPAGFFYHILQAPSPSWTKLTIDIHEAAVGLYTKEHVQEMIEKSDEDPASSYLCQFVGGRDSIFGDLDDEDLTDIYEAVAFD